MLGGREIGKGLGQSTSGFELGERNIGGPSVATLQMLNVCIVWLLCVFHSGLSVVTSLVATGVKVLKCHMTELGGSMAQIV